MIRSNDYSNLFGEPETECIDFSDFEPIRNSKSILDELSQSSFSEPVKNRADHIYSLMCSSKNVGRKKPQIVFACVCYAHRELGIAYEPKEIAEELKIAPKKINKALASFLYTEYRPKFKIFTTIDFVDKYGLDAGIGVEHLAVVRTRASKLMAGDPELERQYFPQTLAVALLLWYTNIHGIEFEQRYLKNTYRIQTTLKTLVSRIIELASSMGDK
jgi:transcription initiation factor TFIIIB Brf1 subunit/transcription initiation factor TFIIB